MLSSGRLKLEDGATSSGGAIADDELLAIELVELIDGCRECVPAPGPDADADCCGRAPLSGSRSPARSHRSISACSSCGSCSPTEKREHIKRGFNVLV